MEKNKLLIYGANGFTGKLVIQEALKLDLAIVAAGRNAEALNVMASEYDAEVRVFSLNDIAGVANQLKDIHTVVNCAGPFHLTYKIMSEACIQTGTHYLDITGEWKVFEALQSENQRARQKSIMIMPGAGFDVVPSDCLAMKLKPLMPDATCLTLAFCSIGGSWSGGTINTMIDGIGEGGKVRINGKLKTVPYAHKTQRINFGDFEAICTTIPWGDICTAWFSTGIPNIEVYLGVNKSMVRQMKLLNWLVPLLKAGCVRKFLKKQVDNNRPRIEKKTLNTSFKTYFYCKLENTSGDIKEGRLLTINGYLLTAKAASLIAKKCLSGNFKTGYQTPATAYGFQLIEEIEGSRFF